MKQDPAAFVVAPYLSLPLFPPVPPLAWSLSVVLMNNEGRWNPVAQIVPAVGYSSPVLIK